MLFFFVLLSAIRRMKTYGFFAPFFSAFFLLTKERSGRWICRPFIHCCLLLLNGYSLGLYFGVGRECPVYLFIGQGAVNASTHHQTTILQNFLPCILFAIGKDFKHTLKNVLCPYPVNSFLLHNLKIRPLIICIPLAHHSITYDVLAKNDVYHIHRQRTCRVPFLRLSV